MSPHGAPLNYPPTRRTDHTDDYHGTIVADPYRWLEDLDSDETAAFVRAQNEVTFDYLAKIPERDALKARITQLWDYEKFSAPSHTKGRYFWLHNDGLQNQSVLFTASSLDAEPEVLLDPNTWSEDGTVAMVGGAVSEDGTLLAYGIAHAGSDWNEWRVLDIATRVDLPDRIERVKFSVASWVHDDSGFYYSRYDEQDDLETSNLNHKVYFHRVGDHQSADELIYERVDHPDWLLSANVSEDGTWLIITVHQGTSPHNGIVIKDLDTPGAPFVDLLLDFDAAYTFVDSLERTLIFRTNLDAPLGRVITIDVDAPERSAWRTLIAESSDVLEGVGTAGGRLFCGYLAHAHSVVKVASLDGTFEREVELPGLGTAIGFGGRREDRETFYTFSSFTEAASIYRYDIASGESTLHKRASVAFDADAFETTQIFYPSKDGTTVPMFLVHRRGLALDGTYPTFLYGYGGFNNAMTPAFSPSMIAWLEMGGVFAQACIRGGSEYGEAWHQAGTKERKQNVFDDFIAAAEWLIDSGYTSSQHLGIGGGSNGGLLVGACITQRPELFGAARIAVGVLDMLRFHRFTIGWAWVSDYGSADNEDDFKYLYEYSPLHNISAGTQYPPTLITTGDHDDRVVPSHSFKFAATLQPAQGGSAPILLRVDVRAGHGMGKPTTKMIEEAADAWAFLAHHTGALPR